MGLIRDTKVSLRFRGDDLEPDVLTKSLGVQPSNAAAKGGTQSLPNGRSRVTPEGYWHLSSPLAETEPLDAHIKWLFAATTPDLAVWQGLARYRGDLFVGLFLDQGMGGVILGPVTLHALAERHIELDLDIYG